MNSDRMKKTRNINRTAQISPNNNSCFGAIRDFLATDSAPGPFTLDIGEYRLKSLPVSAACAHQSTRENMDGK